MVIPRCKVRQQSLAQADKECGEISEGPLTSAEDDTHPGCIRKRLRGECKRVCGDWRTERLWFSEKWGWRNFSWLSPIHALVLSCSLYAEDESVVAGTDSAAVITCCLNERHDLRAVWEDMGRMGGKGDGKQRRWGSSVWMAEKWSTKSSQAGDLWLTSHV